MAQDQPHDYRGRGASAAVDDRDLAQLARLAEIGLSVAATTHDLRQPLSTIRMALQLARERVAAGADASAELEEALRQLGRVETLVERTRNLFSARHGWQTLDLVELIGEIAATLRWQPVFRGGIRLEAAFGDEIPLISGDRALLEQLVVNLINNARDAVEERGGGRVLLSLREDAGSGGVELVIADDGAGIPFENVERLFEPFFTTKGEGKGTGLGLYIVRRVAEEHGAKLSLMSAAELAALDLGPLATGFRVIFLPAPGEEGGRP
jgi:signal transduction histidine kinase